jgi:hypothetical protein
MKAVTVGELIDELSGLDRSAEVWATDQYGVTESPVTSVQVRDGLTQTVLLDFELSVDQ